MGGMGRALSAVYDRFCTVTENTVVVVTTSLVDNWMASGLGGGSPCMGLDH